MYLALTYLTCVALVFVLAASLFVVSVAILMAVEGLKIVRHMAFAAGAATTRSLISLSRPAWRLTVKKELVGAPIHDGKCGAA